MQTVSISKDSNEIPQKNYQLFIEPKESLFFNSKFDSGNMHRIKRNSYDHYSIWTASDAQGTSNQGYPKSWFYFETGGFINRKVSFSIHRVHFLWAMNKKIQMYRPVCQINYHESESSNWTRIPTPIHSLCINNDQQLILKFDFFFSKDIKSVYFAFIYPYSYSQCCKDIQLWKQQFNNDNEICFNNYQLTKSVQNRKIDVLLISSHEGKQQYENIKIDDFVNFNGEKIIRYRNNKPIIFISARVHPIQTPSSYCMKGIISFLLDKNDLRAHLLRKYFVFVLIPMLNPDGVANGHCRMDSLNQNLNRYYKNPDPYKQPSCYAVRKLCEHYNKDKRMFMYLDLHAHPAYKGNFIFGNAIFDYIEQVESHLFPKVLSQNCINFQFQQCIFSRKHMKAKDRNEQISKQGCGRVVFYKDFGLIHSYTLECGYHVNSYDNELSIEKNLNKKFAIKYKINNKGQRIYENYEKVIQLIEAQQQQIKTNQNQNLIILKHISDPIDIKTSDYYLRNIIFFNQDTFYNLGRNIMISILDIWNKNPYSRIINMNSMRIDIAQKQSKLDRFRKQQSGIKSKQKKIVELIQEQCYAGWHQRKIFTGFNLPYESKNKDKNKNSNNALQIGRNIMRKTYKGVIKPQQPEVFEKSKQTYDQISLQTRNIPITNQMLISNDLMNKNNQNIYSNIGNRNKKNIKNVMEVKQLAIVSKNKIQIRKTIEDEFLEKKKQINKINQPIINNSTKVIKNNINLSNMRIRSIIVSNNYNNLNQITTGTKY